jgi:hypothetical protein
VKLEEDETISAQVILSSATGQKLGPTSQVTKHTLRHYTPSADHSAKAIKLFEMLGFEVGPLIGISFSLTGPVAMFRKVFDVDLRREEDKSLVVLDSRGGANPELPATALSDELRHLIAHIVFESPAKLI